MFAIKLANFLMFTVSEENTVNYLEGSLDIFGSVIVGPRRWSSEIFDSLWESSVAFENCLK